MVSRGVSEAAGWLLTRNEGTLSTVAGGRVALGKWEAMLLLRLSGRRSRASVAASYGEAGRLEEDLARDRAGGGLLGLLEIASSMTLSR